MAAKNDYLEKVFFLIVDDNPFMRTLVKNVLYALGVKQIKEASNGEEALEILQTWPADIVFADWEMDPVDGIALTRAIRTGADSTNSFVPIVMVSGHAQRPRVMAARDAGVNEFVVKPITAATLFSRIRAVIEKPRPFVRTKTFFGPDRRRGRTDYQGPERRGTGEGETVVPPPSEAMEQAEINRLFDATPDDATADDAAADDAEKPETG